MRVYIAAPWVRKHDAIQAGRAFEAAGFKVLSRWFNHEGDPNDATGVTCEHQEVYRQALEDVDDVQRADYLIVLNLEKSEGKAVETGIAIANGIPFICVGPRSNVFQVFAEAMVDSVDDAIAHLHTISAAV